MTRPLTERIDEAAKRLSGKARRMDVWLDRVAEGGGVAPTKQEIEEADDARETAALLREARDRIAELERATDASEQAWRDTAGTEATMRKRAEDTLRAIDALVHNASDEEWRRLTTPKISALLSSDPQPTEADRND